MNPRRPKKPNPAWQTPEVIEAAKELYPDNHLMEAIRLQEEIDKLGPEFAEDGPVRFVLRERIKGELERSRCTTSATARKGDK